MDSSINHRLVDVINNCEGSGQYKKIVTTLCVLINV